MPNDYVEVKFLEADNGDISVTKFLDGQEDDFADDHYELENDLMENGKKKKKAAPENGKKKKKSKDSDYDPHEVIVHFQNELLPEYYLQ